jgi:hypothetical protein
MEAAATVFYLVFFVFLLDRLTNSTAKLAYLGSRLATRQELGRK